MKKIGIIITVCVVSLMAGIGIGKEVEGHRQSSCLLYTSPSPRDG